MSVWNVLALRPREGGRSGLPCPVRKRGLADCDGGWVTAMSRWVDRFFPGSCGMPMLCPRTGSPCLTMGHTAVCASYTKGGWEGKSKQVDPTPGPLDIGIPSGSDGHRRFFFWAR